MFVHEMRMQWRFWILTFGLMVLGQGCENEPANLGVSYNTFDQNYGVVLVDTIKIATSTVLLDSIPTSGTGSLLIGGYDDPKLGKLRAEGYVQVGSGDVWEPEPDAIFDSLVLVTKYSGYYYGDTTGVQTVEVRRITQSFKTYSLPRFWVDERQYSALYKEGSLYNNSTLRYDASILGSRTLRLRPGSNDSLSIRLADALGREWLELAQNKSSMITDATKFIEYFKGVSISTSSSQPTSVIGVTTAGTKVRLYYRDNDGEKQKQYVHEFPFSENLFNYTNISADRSGTVLENIMQENGELFAYRTGEEAFIQSGTGVVTKVKFPYIRKMIDLKDLLIVNQAQLILQPVKDSYSGEYPLPLNLTLFETDKSNLPLKQLYADYSVDVTQKAYISIDKELDTSTGYVFTITQYIQNLLSSEGNLEKGLLIMPSADEINTRVNRAWLNAGSGASYKVTLKIWFTQKK